MSNSIKYDSQLILNKLIEVINESGLSYGEIAKRTGIPKSSIHRYAKGQTKKIPIDAVRLIADATGVSTSYIMGREDNKSNSINLLPPNITENYTTFPVIVEVAAGFEHIVMEDWEGDTVDISNDYLKGRDKSEFFVIRVKGDSMYPEYQDGDRVLILKQPTVNYSGQVGVVMYDDELGTLKRVEYKQGENWMRLVAINPAYAPKKIENEDLEHCRILGIPKLIIREIEE